MRKKVLYGVVVVIGFFALLELALALIGVDSVVETSDPFVGFEPGVPLFVREDDRYLTNPLKLSFFNSQSFPVEKSPQTFRIFCLGGSTTYGRPYDHRTYFGSWLGAYLNEVAPAVNWEVINCGGISYASYRIALLMDELSEYEPDLFIVYTGHNEFLEERTYHDVRSQHPAMRRAIWLASHSRTFSLLQTTLRSPAPAPEQRLSAEVNTILEVVGPEAYHRDEELKRGVLEHFRLSLGRIIGTARRAGAHVILVQPAANLKDFSPFKSEHSELTGTHRRRWEQLLADGERFLSEENSKRAVTLLREAETMAPRHAYGLWCLADALLADGHDEESLEYFVRSKDEDVCPLRALSEINAIIAEVSETHDVEIVDFPQLLETEHGLWPSVGFECFCDHVHPTNGAHRVLGRALCQKLLQMGIIAVYEDSQQLHDKVRGQVLSSLTDYDHVIALHNVAMTLSWAGKNREALGMARAAAENLPQHPEVVSLYGRLLEKQGRDKEALKVYEQAVDADPHDSMALARLGTFHYNHKDYESASAFLKRSVQNTPELAPLAFRVDIRLRLGDCLAATGDEVGALAVYREAEALAPDSPRVRQRLAASPAD